MRFSTGLSAIADTALAIRHACEQVAVSLRDDGDQGVDLALVFFSSHHIPKADEIALTLTAALDPQVVLGVCGDGVLAGGQELDKGPGIAVMAARLPGVTLKTFTTDEMPLPDGSEASRAGLEACIGAGPDLRAVLMLADPFSVPLVQLLPALSRAKGPSATLLGGMASGGKKAESHAMILNGEVRRSGAIGVSLSGAIRVDAAVSQGCRPFGPLMVVTKAKGNLIFELGGKPALDAMQEAVNELGEGARQALANGLFVGRVINEYKDRFGRNDFLIRGIAGVAADRGAVAVNELIKVGQTIRLHVLDAATARQDLAMVMDAQALHDKPRGALVITSRERGEKLFQERGVDSRGVYRPFVQPSGGEELARGGTRIDPSSPPPFALAGFFAAGEIGPVGPESFMHHHAACVALFREA